jgi:hypothetical protein
MSVEDNTSPKFGLNHPFNTGLGIPIARQSDDAQGTLTLLFKEMKMSSGDPSERIFALTNKHVASVDTTTDYEFVEANPQHILVCGEVKDLESKSGTGKENKMALKHKKDALNDKNENNTTLQTFFAEVNAEWQDTDGRRFGVVDWAPNISVRVDDRHYTRDVTTFAVDGETHLDR